VKKMMIQFRKQNTKSTAIKAGIAGAVIGAAGAAIGIAMTDEKNREMVKNKVDDAKKWTGQKMQDIKPAAEDTTKQIKAATNRTNGDDSKTRASTSK
jgi:hypothetical protein